VFAKVMVSERGEGRAPDFTLQHAFGIGLKDFFEQLPKGESGLKRGERKPGRSLLVKRLDRIVDRVGRLYDTEAHP
jgi:hypothetical protein